MPFELARRRRLDPLASPLPLTPPFQGHQWKCLAAGPLRLARLAADDLGFHEAEAVPRLVEGRLDIRLGAI